jgi:hypothetical protein
MVAVIWAVAIWEEAISKHQYQALWDSWRWILEDVEVTCKYMVYHYLLLTSTKYHWEVDSLFASIIILNFGPEYDCWMNLDELQQIRDEYEHSIGNTTWSPLLLHRLLEFCWSSLDVEDDISLLLGCIARFPGFDWVGFSR